MWYQLFLWVCFTHLNVTLAMNVLYSLSQFIIQVHNMLLGIINFDRLPVPVFHSNLPGDLFEVWMKCAYIFKKLDWIYIWVEVQQPKETYEITHMVLMFSEEQFVMWHAILLQFGNGLSNKLVGLQAEIHMMFRTHIVSDNVKTWEKPGMIEYNFPHRTVVLEGCGVSIIGIANLGVSISNRGPWTATCLWIKIARVRSMWHTITALMFRQDITRGIWVQVIMVSLCLPGMGSNGATTMTMRCNHWGFLGCFTLHGEHRTGKMFEQTLPCGCLFGYYKWDVHGINYLWYTITLLHSYAHEDWCLK